MIPEAKYLFLMWVKDRLDEPTLAADGYLEMLIENVSRGLKWKFVSKVKQTKFQATEDVGEMLWAYQALTKKSLALLRNYASIPEEPDEVEQRLIELVAELAKEISE